MNYYAMKVEPQERKMLKDFLWFDVDLAESIVVCEPLEFSGTLIELIDIELVKNQGIEMQWHELLHFLTLLYARGYARLTLKDGRIVTVMLKVLSELSERGIDVNDLAF